MEIPYLLTAGGLALRLVSKPPQERQDLLLQKQTNSD